MALSVNTNIGALSALASASNTNKSLETSMARLASGKRINSAADDAAGLAIASRLTAEIRGTNMAIRNASDGQALVNTADGASAEVVNILQRMRELGNQAANDTNSDQDRTNISSEMGQLKSEINRIANTTTWAGVNLLDGSVPSSGLNIQVGSNTSSYDTMTVAIDSITAENLGLSGTAATGVTTTSLTLGVHLSVGVQATVAATTGIITLDTTLAAGAATVIIAKADGTTVAFTYTVTSGQAGSTLDSNREVAAGLAALINAANLGLQAKADMTGAAATIAMTTGDVDVSSTSSALATVNAIDTALNTVNTQRAMLGATSNRLDSTIANLTNVVTNLEAGKGRIEDADFASESTNMARAQILQQAATAMLAQANSSKQGVLQLLQR
jgi:flagellin